MLGIYDCFDYGTGYDVSFENLGNIQNLAVVLETFSSKKAGYCYDSCHHKNYAPNEDFLKRYGNRLMALHLQDNGGKHNQHQLPFDGSIDWAEVMLKIAQTGYQGATTLEPMNSKKILLTAFRGTSAQLLIQNAKNYQTLILPNDKIKDSELLIEAILKEKFDYVISFGQRPNIKDKVHIETTAREGELHIGTSFDCERLRQLFEQKGISAKLSYNAGMSFCNKLYLNGLQYIGQNELTTQMAFVHIPFEKNIMDFDSFRGKIFEAVAELEDMEI